MKFGFTVWMWVLLDLIIKQEIMLVLRSRQQKCTSCQLPCHILNSCSVWYGFVSDKTNRNHLEGTQSRCPCTRTTWWKYLCGYSVGQNILCWALLNPNPVEHRAADVGETGEWAEMRIEPQRHFDERLVVNKMYMYVIYETDNFKVWPICPKNWCGLFFFTAFTFIPIFCLIFRQYQNFPLLWQL